MPLKDHGDAVTVHLSRETPRALRQAIGRDEPFTGRFELPLTDDQLYLGRTSPIVEGLASWTIDQALDAAARDTAQGIQDSISKSERGVEISERVKLSLQEIVLSIRAMDEVAGEVASHSTEQNQGISQVNSAVADMDKLTQSDAASAEECAAAARQLQNQAARLNRAVEEVGRLVQGRGGEPATAPAPSLAPVPQPAARGTAPGVREPRASAKVPATPQSF